jgi:hypothetical protein
MNPHFDDDDGSISNFFKSNYLKIIFLFSQFGDHTRDGSRLWASVQRGPGVDGSLVLRILSPGQILSHS